LIKKLYRIGAAGRELLNYIKDLAIHMFSIFCNLELEKYFLKYFLSPFFNFYKSSDHYSKN